MSVSERSLPFADRIAEGAHAEPGVPTVAVVDQAVGQVSAREGTHPGGYAARRALVPVGLALALVATSTAVALWADPGRKWLLRTPPIFGDWDPHVGVGTVPALGCLGLTLALQRRVGRWPWRTALLAGYGLSVAWTLALAAVDGGWERTLTRSDEYLHELPRISEAGSFLRGFTDGILDGPDAWTTHVAGHPPLATLTFWALERLGVRGGGGAGLLCILVGSVAGVSWATVVHRLDDSRRARAALPVLVATPAAVWVGVSADGLFAGVAAAGAALVCLGIAGRSVVAALLGGLLLGALPYLSYGLVLFAVPVAVTGLLSCRRVGWSAARRGVLLTVLSASVVPVAMTASGFSWWQGMGLLRVRYDQGVAGVRPSWYFLWANPAALTVCLSPALGVAVWAIVRTIRAGRLGAAPAAALLPLASLSAMVLADLSAMSKAETERIWLPFAVLVPVALALVPTHWRRWCLTGGATWALLVNHLIRTGW